MPFPTFTSDADCETSLVCVLTPVQRVGCCALANLPVHWCYVPLTILCEITKDPFVDCAVFVFIFNTSSEQPVYRPARFNSGVEKYDIYSVKDLLFSV